MIALIEQLLLALTDAQFDKVLAMVERGFMACEAAIKALSTVLLPLLVTWVAWKCQAITKNQKSNRAALDENTEINKTAIITSNSYNEKIASSLAEIAELKKQMAEIKPPPIHRNNCPPMP